MKALFSFTMILILFFTKSFSQNNQDTLYVYLEKLSYLYKQNIAYAYEYAISVDTCVIRKRCFQYVRVENSALKNYERRYTVFYLWDSTKIAEGVYTGSDVGFSGKYKVYYRNGKLREIGENSYVGEPLQRRIYYKRNGKERKKIPRRRFYQTY